MSNFTSSQNPCGRRILYPHFGDERLDIPPPGVDVSASPCTSYYRARDFSGASDECKQCIADAWSYDRACPCAVKDTTKEALCEYASCVARKNIFCPQQYAAIFNEGDLDDGSFLPPFSLRELKCEKRED